MDQIFFLFHGILTNLTRYRVAPPPSPPEDRGPSGEFWDPLLMIMANFKDISGRFTNVKVGQHSFLQFILTFDCCNTH